MNISLVSGVTTRLLMESKSWNCDNQTLPVWTVAYWSPGWTHLLWNLSAIMWKGKRQGRPTIASKTIFLAIFGNVTNMAMHLLRRGPWGNIWKLHLEKDLSICSGKSFKETFENSLWRNLPQVQAMWLYICWGREFEETYENSLWRKFPQVQTMRLCICWGESFKETFENALWRKILQMQSMRLCICWGKWFKETFEKALWRKTLQMQTMRLCICSSRWF